MWCDQHIRQESQTKRRACVEQGVHDLLEVSFRIVSTTIICEFPEVSVLLGCI